MTNSLTRELITIKNDILKVALDYGLDPFTTIFELVDYDELNAVASYGGFPTRYPHWKFGMEYEELSKTYAYGLQKIYELVINNDPCYAYLMKSNSLIDQKLVIAHVYAHSDFFKNNMWFGQTNRKMVDEMANHSTRIRRYADKHGETEVESFIDTCLSLENLIDTHSMYSIPKSSHSMPSMSVPDTDRITQPQVVKLKSKEYMDKYINTPGFMRKQKEKIQEAEDQKKNFPPAPEKDVLKFLIDYAPVQNWQKDILYTVREESYYFAPQAMTKIMNEGWASYWHSKILTQKVLAADEIIDFADHHSGTVAVSPGRLNPYKLGLEIFRDIEDRWNKGKFGKEYAECDDINKKRNWNLNLNLGQKKIFEVRKIYNDITFIDEFFTMEFCENQKMFAYKLDPATNQYVITDREFEKVKKALLFRLTNMGHPHIAVENGNYKNRGELLLRHYHNNTELQLDEAIDVMKNIYLIWQRPVNILTLSEGDEKTISYDGQNVKKD